MSPFLAFICWPLTYWCYMKKHFVKPASRFWNTSHLPLSPFSLLLSLSTAVGPVPEWTGQASFKATLQCTTSLWKMTLALLPSFPPVAWSSCLDLQNFHSAFGVCFNLSSLGTLVPWLPWHSASIGQIWTGNPCFWFSLAVVNPQPLPTIIVNLLSSQTDMLSACVSAIWMNPVYV